MASKKKPAKDSKKAVKKVAELVDGPQAPPEDNDPRCAYFPHYRKGSGQTFGRPSKYDPAYCDQIIEHMAKGYSAESFADKIGTVKQRLYEWSKAHADFQDALAKAQQACFVYWENIGFMGITNQISFFDGKSWQFWMAARFGIGQPDSNGKDNLRRQILEDALKELDQLDEQKRLQEPK